MMRPTLVAQNILVKLYSWDVFLSCREIDKLQEELVDSESILDSKRKVLSQPFRLTMYKEWYMYLLN